MIQIQDKILLINRKNMLYDSYEIERLYDGEFDLNKYIGQIRIIIEIIFYKYNEKDREEMRRFLIGISFFNFQRFKRSYSTICYNY